MANLTGTCLCGETVFSARLQNNNVHACHCSICRKQTSGPLMVIDIEPTSLEFSMDDNLKIYNSSEWAERGFCSNCGTVLFFRTKDLSSYAAVNVFSLDIPSEELKFTTEVHIDSKPSFYDFLNDTHQLTEADLLAMFDTDNK